MLLGAMNHPAKDVVAEIAWIAHHGFDFVDLTLEPPAADPRTLDVPSVVDSLEQFQLPAVIHTAYYLAYATPFSSVRRACLEEFQIALEVAVQLQARVMTVHFSRPPRFFSEEDVIRWHKEVLGPLCEKAETRRITLALEHSPFPQCRQIDILERLFEELPTLRFHLDSGHAQLEPVGDRWSEYLDRLGRYLVHVHLSENDGAHDQHLPPDGVPGQSLNWPVRLSQLKALPYDGTITLEVFSPASEYLLTARDLVRRWWNDLPDRSGAASVPSGR